MRYMALLYMPAEQVEKTPEEPDMAPWLEFNEYAESKGANPTGEPLQGTSTATTVRVRDGETLTTDGPFAETKEVLGGYYVLECPDLDAALDLAARIPSAAYGSVEVRPLMEIPGE
jgi:hypothetical protein